MALSTGLETTQINFANIENKGIEFEIKANIIDKRIGIGSLALISGRIKIKLRISMPNMFLILGAVIWEIQ